MKTVKRRLHRNCIHDSNREKEIQLCSPWMNLWESLKNRDIIPENEYSSADRCPFYEEVKQ